MQVGKEHRTLGGLFSDLMQDTRTLVRQEIELAKVEMGQKASQAGKGVAFAGIGGAVAYAGFLAILAAAVIGLAEFIPAWLSALIVGLIVAVVGYVLIRQGLNMLNAENLTPQQTIRSLQEDREWLKDEVSGNGRS